MKEILLLSILFTSCLGSTSNENSDSRIQSVPKIYSVENVRIVKEHSNAWAVKGVVRNDSNRSIKGAVKIKFLNSRGDIVYSTKAYVNDGDPLQPGQAGAFEYYKDPETFNGVNNFDVEFYER